MNLLKAFGRFWYDFLIGDDWKIAASVVAALGLLVALLLADVVSDQLLCVIGAVLVAGAFTISLLIDVRESGAKG